ncbi:MAG: cupin domain-containing protein [Pseudomonadota bacterium]
MTGEPGTSAAPYRRGNLLDDLAMAKDERFEPLFEGHGFRLLRIVSTGQTTPPGEWYDQDEDEWVVVMQGQAELVIEDQEGIAKMGPGDWILLPAHCRHRVERTSIDPPTVWLALHADRPDQKAGKPLKSS